ncbi:Cas9 inhibitor AcrIIA9 family protein [Enterococcus casseliflavus]|uniref:Cas9 inhibitor AcrIIA9 family protein n=1 Tax=Enterococcus casseliflavus TaxID=37734 RepID=UPI00232FB1D4|nr:Cas9 inhibitor AcrIIA9 family protein [Enterococcus casseliflavus]MDB1696144.1 Cas9 inhibitor AcrIIA9 family protein [Enterococcus casseliflavus]MDB1699760.1 Cas9 inhibitor AcrIIA9 family protein [Enterococcus casseliflavus]MDB1702310.1 Cas9 inhibitor AcrIIA9 family protein [Enterococcus casseliflavus]MDB1704602.1 Cas9 inhibitor AcrIIA9 family protein [Enterococcus casseliflavus]
MNRIKRVALEKLTNELTEQTSPSEKWIFEWLGKQKDIALYQGILTPEKSLKKAYQYAYSQAVHYQVGGCAIIDDELVYLWIAHYFKQPVTVVTNDFAKEMVQKSKTKQEEPKKPQNINQVKSKKKATKETNSTKTKPKMMEGEQLSLLDML